MSAQDLLAGACLLDRFGAQAPLLEPEAFEALICAEGEGWLAVNKPGWLVCHPSKQGPYSSLAGAARASLELETVHLVNRLDRETSGLLLLALEKEVARKLGRELEQGRLSKEYLAVLVGELDEACTLVSGLEADADSPVAVKMRVCEGEGADTTFEPLAQGRGHTLVRVKPGSGRKHQIRVHAAHLGYPILGDKLYGPDEQLYLRFAQGGLTAEMLALLRFPRQALHAHRLRLEGGRLLEAPLAEEMCELVERLFGARTDL